MQIGFDLRLAILISKQDAQGVKASVFLFFFYVDALCCSFIVIDMVSGKK